MSATQVKNNDWVHVHYTNLITLVQSPEVHTALQSLSPEKERPELLRPHPGTGNIIFLVCAASLVCDNAWLHNAPRVVAPSMGYFPGLRACRSRETQKCKPSVHVWCHCPMTFARRGGTREHRAACCIQARSLRPPAPTSERRNRSHSDVDNLQPPCVCILRRMLISTGSVNRF